jgi:predicted Fe-Mo cluster-binding NifX family protein
MYAADVIVCVPISSDGTVDPRWGRADSIAVAEVVDGTIENWEEFHVSWSTLHDEGSSARHHARIAKFLLDHHISAVVANHVGDGMVKMLATMGLPLHLGAEGDARAAVLAAVQ